MSTRQDSRSVLFVVHTVASANRLLDLVPLFDADLRVALHFTCPEDSTAPDGVAECFAALGIQPLSWQAALAAKFDLAITANHRGDLHELSAPVMIVSHGVGYTKNSPGNRKSEIGNRKSAYGLSPEYVLRDGEVIASSLVLSHSEQLDRLARDVPQALGVATVAGDPCLDRLRASTLLRRRYRDQLGLRPGQRLIVISSTWNQGSVFGTWPRLYAQLMAELPVDEYRVAGIVHPHVWHGSGPFELRRWLADCVRAGLLLIPPLEGWGPALIAADAVVGDHGAVTAYGAALDRPVLLAAFPEPEVVPGTSVDLLGRTAPRLDPTRPLRPQLDRVLEEFLPGQHRAVADLVSSHPDQAAARHRALAYHLLGLPEPTTPALVPLLAPDRLPRPARAAAVRITGRLDGDAVHLTRHAADVLRGRPLDAPELADPHLVAHLHHPDRTLRQTAEVLLCQENELSFAALPSCRIFLLGDQLRLRDGRRYRVESTMDSDPALAASAVLLLPDPPRELRVVTGAIEHRFRLTPPAAAPG
ncbi:hypothetical protein M8C13_26990 [Crossiella sp. SN42]|uniref:hypothetical protein n=1 Tax=Crossiella sp. SN42 TaxID=2944808 RepID=UPI00207C8060|nr:hypothetical protein [Crossiella sp. SN42]MCO1579402.1 hypothetical protein [Crossiella sp. SN42]